MGSLPKIVQELASKGGEIPEKYVHKEGDGGAPNALVMDVPVIDIGLLSSSAEELDKLCSALNTWVAFRSTLHEYSLKLKSIGVAVLQAMARSLRLEENCFVDQYGERSKIYAGFNFYPKCPRPDLVLGMKPHAESSGIILVLQDESVEGLQFLKDDKWYKAPIIPEALLINVGDQAETSSNGMFKSPVHRMVTNAERERTSVAVFYVPDPETDIEPFEDLINESTSRLYRMVKNLLTSIFSTVGREEDQ